MRAESERDERLMTLVLAALEQPSEMRASYLRSACGNDLDLYTEVSDRVSWEEKMTGFLCNPVIEVFELLDRQFESGQLIADRFRVLSEVGRGGMGVVYEAFDEKLDRRVALKAALGGHDNRLPPEVRAAREVSHFNVCKVHELHSTRTAVGEMEFLVMEYIEGETLSAHVRNVGPLSTGTARDIARQICAGLAQAHRQGVIHGDLKCGNIILSQAPDGGTRAVITDFGLAAMNLPGKGDQVTQLGGSLDYMSPELFAGGSPTVASDVYALGVVLHVMLTGSLPAPVKEPFLPSDASTLTMGGVFSAWRLATRRCQKLPAPWSRIVRRCLDNAPEHRFASAAEVIDALETGSRKPKWRAAFPLAVAGALAVALWLGHDKPVTPVRLAVLPFSVEGNVIPSAAGIGVDIAQRLSSARRNFKIISPREAVDNGVDAAAKARSILGATHALQAHLRRAGQKIVVFASVTDLESGHNLRELNGSYSLADTSAIAKAILATVTGAFQLSSAVPKESVSPAAYPYYVQGIGLLRQDVYNADQAIPLFRTAIEIDSRSALPYAALAEAQVHKFETGAGLQWLDLAEATISKAKSINSDSVQVLVVSGALEQRHSWYDLAIRDFTRATNLDPNNSDAWRQLAIVYQLSSRAEDVAATYRRAINAQPNYYRNYLDFGNYYLSKSQYHDAEGQYRLVLAVAPGLASGYTNLGLALMRQGRLQEAEQALLASGHLRRSPRLVLNLGALRYQQERYTEAAQLFRESLTSGPPSAIKYRDLGDAYRRLEHLVEATATYSSGRDLAQDEVNRNPRDAASRVRLGVLLADIGEKRGAESELSQAMALEPENVAVIREVVIAYEILGEREKTLEVLSRAPKQLWEELSWQPQPDVKELQQDPQFQELLRTKSR
jgi:serine/threonine-protein kinase